MVIIIMTVIILQRYRIFLKHKQNEGKNTKYFISLNMCKKIRTFVGKKRRYAKKESWNVV